MEPRYQKRILCSQSLGLGTLPIFKRVDRSDEFGSFEDGMASGSTSCDDFVFVLAHGCCHHRLRDQMQRRNGKVRILLLI